VFGAIVGVLGVVACFTFSAGLDNAVATPQRSGVVWNFLVASGEGVVASHDAATIARDRDVAAALDAEWARALPVNGAPTPTFGTSSLKGDLPLVVLSGRAPRTRDEIAFAPTTMRALRLHVGDQTTVGIVPRRIRVVGEGLLPATSHTDYDEGGWMTADGLRAALPPSRQLGPDDIQDYVLVRWRPGAPLDAAQRRLSALGGGTSYFAAPATSPTAVVDLGRLRTLPRSLGIFFGLLAAATVAHALVTTVRRRQRDLAVLRAIGFTRRQSRGAIASQATLLAIAGVIAGVPLGVLFGRLVWHSRPPPHTRLLISRPPAHSVLSRSDAPRRSSRVENLFAPDEEVAVSPVQSSLQVSSHRRRTRSVVRAPAPEGLSREPSGTVLRRVETRRIRDGTVVASERSAAAAGRTRVEQRPDALA
jgi:hypothetical protein